MSAVGVNSAAEQLEKARTIIAEVSLPVEVAKIDLDTGTDFAGEPALWVFVHIQQDVRLDRQQVKKLTQFTRELQAKIIDAGLTLFPYTSLEQAA